MSSIASIGVRIDTSDVQKAESDLDKLARTAANTEQAAGKVGTAWQQAGDKMGKAAAPAAKVADAFKQGSAAIKAQQAELASLIGKIDPVVGALGRLDDMEQQLRKHSASGLLGKEDFGAYSAKIAQMRNALTMADVDFNKVGISAKQTAAALRGVPAQFTDIATSLAGGQNPLTVLLQQGGQLKDTFGGVAPAAQALGGYVAGLVNPFTAAAAAAAVLALAYKQGSDEATAYSKAIILTGNYAGTSSEQMQNMAAAIDLVSGTQASAASALAETAASGKFAATQIEAIATAAVVMEEATGKAVSSTVAEFARLADEPVAASEKLNEQYHYLTAAIYEQIQALDEQGNHAAAAELAIATFGDAMESRGKQVINSLGLMEEAWLITKKAASETWDEMLGVGRTQTPDARLKELQGGATLNAGRLAANGLVLGPLGALYEGYKQAKAQLGENDGSNAAEIVALQKEISERDQKAFDAGQKAKINAEAIAAEKRLKLQADANKTQSDKRKEAQEKYQRDIAIIKKANPLSAFVTDAAIAAGVAGINDDFKDKAAPKTARTPKVAAYQDDAAAKMLQSLREQGAALNEQLSTTGKLTAAEREQVKFAQLIADLKSKDILTADQKSLLANQDSIKVQLEKNAAVAAEVAQRDALNKLQERSAQIQESIKSAGQAFDDANQIEVDGIGKGRKKREQDKEMRAIAKEFQRYQEQLNRAADNGTLSSDAYKKGTKEIKDQLDERLKAQKKHYKDLDKAQGSWQDGAQEAFQNYIDNAKDIASTTTDIIGGTMDALTDGIADSFATAIVQGDDLRTSLSNVALAIETELLSSLIKLGIQYATNALIGETVGGAATAASIGMASATAAAWAPAAAMASLGSFGANSSAAMTGMSATSALAKSLSVVGFERGGYTGNGGTSEVAGLVHGKEFVFDAAATSRIGVDNLESMRAGKVVNLGTPLAAGQTSQAIAQASGAPITVSNHFDMRGMEGKAAKESGGAIAKRIAGAVGRAQRYT